MTVNDSEYIRQAEATCVQDVFTKLLFVGFQPLENEYLA